MMGQFVPRRHSSRVGLAALATRQHARILAPPRIKEQIDGFAFEAGHQADLRVRIVARFVVERTRNGVGRLRRKGQGGVVGVDDGLVYHQDVLIGMELGSGWNHIDGVAARNCW